MSRLFVELYLDEDVDVLLADLVRARGFTVVTTRDANQLGADDAAQLAYAASRQKTFMTHNRADFEALAQTYFSSGQPHWGIIIAVRRDPYELARRLLVMLNRVSAEEMRNQLRYI
jgi:predicted nuclease of predicted toxin-antitoxin system